MARLMFLSAVLLVLFAASGFAVQEMWAARYNGPGNGGDNAYAIAVDSSGNAYVTGRSKGSGTSNDYATVKYNSAGVQQWVARYNGPTSNDDQANAIAVDSSGNVYVTGQSYGSGANFDYATIKYNGTNGAELWVARYDGGYDDYSKAIVLDSSGNVYVTGYSYSGSNQDYATVKYDSAGTQKWVKMYDGPAGSDDYATSIAVDSSSNVYVTGYSPGSGIGYDYATIKYNSAGSQQWVARYNGPGSGDDLARAIAIDASGNPYITGYSLGSGTDNDYATVKYNGTNGNEKWVARYDGGNGADWAYAIAVDSSANVYVTGESTGSGTSGDYATIKYNSNGNQQWVARYNGPGNLNDRANAIAVDSSGNVYVTGYSRNASNDYATIKYNGTNGNELWVARYNGPASGGDSATAIALGPLSSVYVTGSSSGSGTGEDYATIKYLEDAVAPSVSTVVPTTATHNALTEFSVSASDNIGVTSCRFYWDGTNVSAMTLISGDATSGTWAANYTPANIGDYPAWANCSDAVGNTAKNETSITVAPMNVTLNITLPATIFIDGIQQNQVLEGLHNVSIEYAGLPITLNFTNANLSHGMTDPISVSNVTLIAGPAGALIYKIAPSGGFSYSSMRVTVSTAAGSMVFDVAYGDPIFPIVPPGGTTGGLVGTVATAPEIDPFLVIVLFCLAVLVLSARKIGLSA